jgi:hypothetical protein
MMTLEELASDWLAPLREDTFSLPAITNFQGVVQAAWGAAGVQNWICAPTGISTPTGLLFYRDGERIRRYPRRAEYRWKAHEIERRAGGVRSTLRMPAGRSAVIERLRFERGMTIYLVFGGLPRVWRFTDYWNLPPEDVPQLNVRRTDRGFVLDDTKTFGVAEFVVPGKRQVFADLLSWLDGEPPCERGKIGVARLEVRNGDEVSWYGVQGCEEGGSPDGGEDSLDAAQAWESGAEQWKRVWEAAFTPGNGEFSGHLPHFDGELARLYYMGVLSLLMTRRNIPRPTPRSSIATGGQCIWSEPREPPERAYVWGGPEGAPTTSFLWELEFQAPLLARLDPAVLRAQLEALMRVDLHRHWGIETISGAGAGMGYGVNPGAFLSCVADYVRVTGDREWARRHIDYLRSCARAELTDYGDCQNILECVSTYEHKVAAFNALAVRGLRFLAELTGERTYAQQAERLAAAVLKLYAGGPFACEQPDGTRRVVRTILDFVYVGRCMTEDIPEDVRRGMVEFFRQELQTADWLYALSPQDPDALTRNLPAFQTFRADHQATGSYDGWPARAASVLLRFGYREEALAWLRRIQELTREGPFGQAHFIHPEGSAEAGNSSFPSRTRKASFYNGNCYFESAGCGFATTLLEDL